MVVSPEAQVDLCRLGSTVKRCFFIRNENITRISKISLFCQMELCSSVIHQFSYHPIKVKRILSTHEFWKLKARDEKPLVCTSIGRGWNMVFFVDYLE